VVAGGSLLFFPGNPTNLKIFLLDTVNQKSSLKFAKIKYLSYLQMVLSSLQTPNIIHMRNLRSLMFIVLEIFECGQDQVVSDVNLV
jgi:hypothetical protein